MINISQSGNGYGFNPSIEWNNNTDLSKFIIGQSNSSYGNYDLIVTDRLESLTNYSVINNFTLTHGNITINNMDGYEFIYQNNESDVISPSAPRSSCKYLSMSSIPIHFILCSCFKVLVIL